MRRLFCIPLLLSASALSAQTLPWDASVRLAPQFHSYDIKIPFNEKISEFSFPFFVVVPVMPALSVDVGTAFAMATLTRRTRDLTTGAITTSKSELSGLTDTQIRANYTFGQDFVVVTAGLNIPTGSATINPGELEAATRIGSDFLMFPISGFGSGFGATAGVAVAQPMGSWNAGFGASVRQSGEYEPFRNTAGTAMKFQPGPEYRARIGLDHPYGTGHMSFGLTFSKFGDDKANAATSNSGDRYIAQFAMNSSLKTGVDYSFVVWNLYRTSGTLIDGSTAPVGNIANAMMTFGIRAPGDVGIEPSIETRFWAQDQTKSSFLGTLGMRFFVNRGGWAVVPGFGFTLGSMESATLNGYKATLGIRLGT
jgi:hypothetical protein